MFLALSREALEWLRVAVLAAYVVATIGVIFGVGLENEVFKKRTQHVGWLLLLASLGVETYLTIELFVVDSEVIRRQQSTIEQLLNPRKLSSEQKARIAAAVSPYRLPFVIMTSHDAETWDFAMDIAATLKANGWTWEGVSGGIQPLDGRPPAGVTIVDHIEIQGPPERAALVAALVAAIKEPGIIGMADVRANVSPNVKIMTIIAGTKR